MITDEQFKSLNVGDWFYAVTQKDNSPFEQPFIRKFQIIEFMELNDKMSAVTSKKDRIGRHWIFRPRTMHLTYEDALIEKKEILEKIKKFEKERKERDEIYFSEQEAREKQRQEEHENQIRAEERKKVVSEIWQEFEQRLKGKTKDMSIIQVCLMIKSVLDQIENQGDDTNV